MFKDCMSSVYSHTDSSLEGTLQTRQLLHSPSQAAGVGHKLLSKNTNTNTAYCLLNMPLLQHTQHQEEMLSCVDWPSVAT